MLDDTDKERLVAEHLLARAARAKLHFPTFFDFVMRDEKTQRPVKVLPFQRLMMDFLDVFPNCVLMMPPGCGKTSILLARYLWRLGNNCTRRGLYISNTGQVATKFVTLAKEYIETSLELRLVFPEMMPSRRPSDPWTQERFTVDRPPGMKDVSLVAGSIQKGIVGSRLSDIIADDILDDQNTREKEQRDKVWDLHETVLMHRIDPEDSSYVVTNTAWHHDDYVHRLMDNEGEWGVGWPSLLIDIFGNVELRNVPVDKFDPPELRPAKRNVTANGTVANPDGPFRLKGNDLYAEEGEDPDDVMLWPQRWTREIIAEKESKMTTIAFNQTFKNKCQSEETARCKPEWIKTALRAGRDMGHRGMVSRYDGSNPVVIGVDLAFGQGEEYDDTAIMTWEFMPDGRAKLLEALSLQTNIPDIADIVFEKAVAYGDAHVVVESNGAQIALKQILVKKDRGMKLHAFYTGGSGKANKWDIFTGVESLFVMMRNGAVVLPCSAEGRVHKEVQKFVDGCLYYLPSKHTDDRLMASWFAVWYGRKLLGWAAIGEGKNAGLYR